MQGRSSSTESLDPGLRIHARRGLRLSSVGFALFFLILFVPTSYAPVKAALLILTLAGIGFRMHFRERLGLHPRVLRLGLAYVAAGIGFVLLGIVNGNPGAMAMAPVFVVWPAVYLLLAGSVSDVDMIRRVVRMLVIGALAIEVFTLSYILSERGLIPDFLYVALDQGQDINFFGGYVEYNLYSISSLVFLVPFLMASVVFWPARVPAPIARKWVWTGLILGIGLVLISGRRGLMLAVGIAPLTILTLRALQAPTPRASRWRPPMTRWLLRGVPIAIVAYFLLQAAFDVNVSTIWTFFTSGFDTGAGESQLSRQDQFGALIDGWVASPVWGQGLGAVATESIRSKDQPWAYELYYVALLFHTGIIGLTLYASGASWLVMQSVRIARSGTELARYLSPCIVGLASFLVANATNPYLPKFDSLWVIFVPVGIVNCWLLRPSGVAADSPLDRARLQSGPGFRRR